MESFRTLQSSNRPKKIKKGNPIRMLLLIQLRLERTEISLKHLK